MKIVYSVWDEGVEFNRKKWRRVGNSNATPLEQSSFWWFFVLVRCILIHWFNYKSLSNFCILLSYFQLRYSRDLRILKYLKTVPDKWGLTRQVIDHITKSRPVQVTFERESAKTTLALFSNIERTNNITRKVSSAWTWLCSISFVVRECRTLHCFSHRKKFQRCLFTISFSRLKWYLPREMRWYFAFIRLSLT